MNTNFSELTQNELKDVNGGNPLIVVGGVIAAGYGVYEVANGIWGIANDFYDGYHDHN